MGVSGLTRVISSFSSCASICRPPSPYSLFPIPYNLVFWVFYGSLLPRCWRDQGNEEAVVQARQRFEFQRVQVDVLARGQIADEQAHTVRRFVAPDLHHGKFVLKNGLVHVLRLVLRTAIA